MAMAELAHDWSGVIDAERLKTDAGYRLEAFRYGLTVGQHGVMIAAQALMAMEEAGDAIPDSVGRTMLTVLRRVARGRTLPEMVLALRGAPSILARASTYEIEDQEKLARDEAIQVVVPGQEETYTNRLMKPCQLGSALTRQVFGPDGIRTEPEQIAYLEDQRARQEAKIVPKRDEPIYVDLKRGVLVVRQPMTLTRGEVAQFLARMTQ